MKKITLFLILLISVATSFSQDIPEFEGEVSWSELFGVSKKVGSPDILGHDGEFIYLSRYIKRDRFIEKYNIRNLRLEQSMELNLEYKGKELTLINQFMYGETPVLYTSFYNKKTKINHSFIQTINKNTLAVSAPVPVSKTKVPTGKGIMGKVSMSVSGSSGGFSGTFLISENKELGFTKEVEYADQKKKGEALKTISTIGRLYDEDLKLLVENNFELPYQSFLIVETKLSNNGLVYMAGYQTSVEEDASRVIKRDVTVYGQLEILVLEIESGDIEVLEVAVDDREVKAFTFRVNDDDGVVVSGLIGKEDGGVSGGFYVSYNSNLKETSANFIDFEEDFITQGWSVKTKEKLEKKNKKKKKKGEKETKPTFYDYRIRDLIQKPDGTTTLLAEQYYMRVVTRTYTDSQGNVRTTTTYYYYYKDIIALNFDNDGELVWKSVIDKYQVSTNDGGYYSSFFTVVDDNDINIIYNDRESNSVDTEGMSKQQKKQLKRKTVGVRVLLNEEGATSKEKLFEFEEGGLRLVPKICSDANEDLVFLYARSRKGDKLGVIRW